MERTSASHPGHHQAVRQPATPRIAHPNKQALTTHTAYEKVERCSHRNKCSHSYHSPLAEKRHATSVKQQRVYSGIQEKKLPTATATATALTCPQQYKKSQHIHHGSLMPRYKVGCSSTTQQHLSDKNKFLNLHLHFIALSDFTVCSSMSIGKKKMNTQEAQCIHKMLFHKSTLQSTEKLISSSMLITKHNKQLHTPPKQLSVKENSQTQTQTQHAPRHQLTTGKRETEE